MGAVGSGGQYVPRPALLPAAPIDLEQRTAAFGSHDLLNLWMRQTLWAFLLTLHCAAVPEIYTHLTMYSCLCGDFRCILKPQMFAITGGRTSAFVDPVS
ncbi:hypothetical protein UY3_01307 [Chelonia mydas]|uniref:Uncharacterized protein n=1 Tax=Chelonia mydas TaxID=8469 RepID=M7BUC6_CHEMY|nr:hypothetical protein UY3_01307 [Chelonia mydas]